MSLFRSVRARGRAPLDAEVDEEKVWNSGLQSARTRRGGLSPMYGSCHQELFRAVHKEGELGRVQDQGAPGVRVPRGPKPGNAEADRAGDEDSRRRAQF